jgi:predicted dehydrogenase
MSQHIRWGIMGAGAIAAKFAADVRYASNARLQAIASRDPARASVLAHAHDAKVHPSYADLLADETIDAVYIATPNSLHRAHAINAIEAGRAVLCEKPFTLNLAEAREIARYARARRVFCMEAMWTRFLPAITHIRSALSAGDIGEPMLLRADLGFAVPADPTNRFNAPVLGGGALLDLGVYCVSIAHFLFGKPDGICAHAITSPSGVDTQIAVLLTWPRQSALLLSSHAGQLANTLEIVGSAGRISVEGPFIRAKRVRKLKFAPAKPAAEACDPLPKVILERLGVWPMARSFARKILGRDGTVTTFDFPGGGFQFEIDEVGRRLSAGQIESEIMPLDESLAVMETMDAIRAAVTRPNASAPSG